MELPVEMASLQLDESMGEEDKTDATNVAVSTKRDSTVMGPETRASKRILHKKVCLIQGRLMNQMNQKKVKELNSEKEIMDFYTNVNKKWTTKKSSLETIFEEPKEMLDGNVATMSNAKKNRSIFFSRRLTKAKKDKRKARVKKFQLSKGKAAGEKKRKLSLDEVKVRLADSLDSWNTPFE